MLRRSLIVAAFLVAGAAALGAAYLFLTQRGAQIASTEAGPPPGFVGSTEFGDWSLICAPAAEPSVAADSLDAPDTDASLGGPESACRIRHEAKAAPVGDADAAVQDEPQRVLLTVSLSLVGPAKSPALMLRLPPTLNAGDSIMVRSTDGFTLEILTRDCSADECIAAGSLSAEEWDGLIAADAIQVVFPIDDAQLVSVDVSKNGFPDALAALEAAQEPVP